MINGKVKTNKCTFINREINNYKNKFKTLKNKSMNIKNRTQMA